METNQKGIQDVLRVLGGSGANLAALAAAIALLGLLLPFIGIKTNLGLGLDQSASMNGFVAASWAAWLALIAFLAAAASHRVPTLFPYRNLVHFAALALTALAIGWSWFFNPAAAEMKETEAFLGTAPDGAHLASFYPHVGMAVLLIGSVTLIMALRKSAA